MRWIYILLCENDYYYVGETSRLYRRFWEHISGIGGLNTSIYPVKEIVAIYKVDTLNQFFKYNSNVLDTINNNYTIDNQNGYNKWLLKNFNNEQFEESDFLYVENQITESLMLSDKKEWNKVRGGKYTRFDVKYSFPNNEYIKELPICNCYLPCDVKKNEEKNLLYFRCPKKNMWDDFKNMFDINDQPCKFYMEYITDIEFRVEENKRNQKISELFKKSKWLKNVEINDENYSNQCIGGCNRTSKSIKLTYDNQKRNLCYDCLIDKNEELSKKYNYHVGEGKCLIKLK